MIHFKLNYVLVWYVFNTFQTIWNFFMTLIRLSAIWRLALRVQTLITIHGLTCNRYKLLRLARENEVCKFYSWTNKRICYIIVHGENSLAMHFIDFTMRDASNTRKFIYLSLRWTYRRVILNIALVAFIFVYRNIQKNFITL